MDAWQTVGRRSTSSKVFGGERGLDDEFPKLDNTRSIAFIAGIAKDAVNPLKAVSDASWFSVLSESELSLGDLSKVLDLLRIVNDREPSSSKELLEFLALTLDHTETRAALGRLLETECYTLDHLLVMVRYIELIEACWTANANLPKTRFKGIALLFFREFLNKNHTSAKQNYLEPVTEYVNNFLQNFETQEFEERFIDGYPSGYSPPDDFRLIPTFPRSQDVDGGLPFLRPNIEKGSFRSLDDYLDIHFRLLREEYVGALRNGIRDLRKGSFTHDLVTFTGEKTRSGDVVDEFGKISLRITSNHGKLQEFKSGVLIALPRSGLNGFIYLTCVEADRGIVELEFCNSGDSSSFKPTKAHQLLVLKSAYYEAFRHTLDALKSIHQLPFQPSIVHGVQDESQPKHWRRVDQRTLLCENLSLMNTSQLKAFHQALTRKVCLIQGPPGTGKTYVGLRIVEALLKYQVTEKPILVVCYTNHALDQFLEGMLNFTDSIVRMGGRSRSEKLTPYSFDVLRNDMQKKVWLSKEDGKRRYESKLRQKICRKQLLEDEQLLGIIQGRTFYRKSDISKICDEFSLFPDCPEFLEVPELCKEYEAKKELNGGAAPPSDDVEAYMNTRMCSGDVSEEVIANKMRKSRILNRFAFNRIYEKLQYKYCRKGSKPRQALTLNEKWRFYKTLHWRKMTEDPRLGLASDDLKDPLRFEQKCKDVSRQLANRHRRQSEQLAYDTDVVNQLWAAQTAAMLRSRSIIALTTTGASKRRDLLHELNCEIIIVEEAAEILESHLVAILPQKTEQIILIGDHKQLSPCINNYTLERSFNLGVSLFERLINNEMPYVMLNVQHRMKDHFLKLLVPHIYNYITSAPRVHELESIRGMSKDLQFLSHKNNERRTGADSASKSNTYEARMIVALVEHLAYQGYEHHQVVVLCAYAGQQQHVQSALQCSNLGRSIRISTIDDYQGEECDIVIVSFVRCNPQNQIGFLSKPNRVCVALSRARKGLFCFGDFDAYANRSTVWKGILSTLQQLGSVKPYLELRCSYHGTLAQADTPEHFAQYMPRGRCHSACDFVLDCGHRCPHPCHLDDPHPVCRKACAYIHPECGHSCPKRCYQEHGVCEEIVPKLLLCGHTEDGPCFMAATSFECHVRCQKTLGCGHQCGSLCSKPCTRDCMAEVSITRECGHDAVVACSSRDQERTQQSCKTKVEVELNCGHKTKVQCRRSLDLDLLTSKCINYVANVDLPCGHSQTLACTDHQNLELYSCSHPVEVKMLCGHACILPCFRSSDEEVIAQKTVTCSTPIEVLAACEHRVSLPCYLSANAAQFCQERVKAELGCGHPRSTTCSKSRDKVELARMAAACGEQVFVEAPCNHLVDTTCGNQYDEQSLRSQCRVIVEATPGCGHIVRVVCSASQDPIFVQKLCKVGRTVQLVCNHTMEVQCYDTRSAQKLSSLCQEKVENVLSCSHTVEQVCNGTLGDVGVKCKRPCEFVHRCGHTCTGTCASCRGGQNHRPCALACSQTLPCGHPCRGKCGRRCPPCQAPCGRICPHGRCEKKCGEPCQSKNLLCRRKGVGHCPHQSCAAKICWECDCEPCDRQCNKRHDNCDHPCEGMCGEPCVPCFRCKPKRLKEFGGAASSGRYLYVPGCDHLVDAEIMDQVMANWTVGTPRCIKSSCEKDIPVWRRYNCVYNRVYRSGEKKRPDMKQARENLLKHLGDYLARQSKNEFSEDSNDREMVTHYTCQILEDLSCRLRRSKSEDLTLCDLVFKFVQSLTEIHEDVLRVQESLPEGDPLRGETFLLTRDVFEDLAAMVDILPDAKSQWTISVLDDISLHAMRLKFVALLPSVQVNARARLRNLIFTGGRFNIPAANALLKKSGSKLRVEPFYEFKHRR